MKITLDIPDGMVCGFLNGVVETRSELTMANILFIASILKRHMRR